MLEICKFFFQSLNEQGVKYCHWKSNAHLEEALNGETDLDILVLPADKEVFCKIVSQSAMKEVLSPPAKRFPGMADYLGFDHETGKTIHLHVHYKLILGQKYIKNHHLPIEDVLFDNLILKKGVYVPCPELELVMLIIRAHMKVDMLSLFKHGVKDLMRGKYTAFPASIEDEFCQLISESRQEKICEILQQCRLPVRQNVFLDFIGKFSSQMLKWHNIASVQQHMLLRLKGYRRRKSLNVYFLYLYLLVVNSVLFSSFCRPKRKTVVGSGKVISLVGADGSGKSTLIAELNRWLGWKLSAKQYYYGIPKTIDLKIVSYLIRALQKCRLPTAAIIVENFLWFYIARYRWRISKLTQRATQKGITVITDRFPLKEFQSMPEPMDGPRISKCLSLPIPALAKAEEGYYAKIPYPTKAFVLQVSIEELRRRKRDLSLATHKVKADAVNALAECEHISLIDANRPYPDVMLDVKRQIWALI